MKKGATNNSEQGERLHLTGHNNTNRTPRYAKIHWGVPRHKVRGTLKGTKAHLGMHISYYIE